MVAVRARASHRDDLRIVGEIRAGRVEPHPADPDKCRFCDFRDVCRYKSRRPALAEGASSGIDAARSWKPSPWRSTPRDTCVVAGPGSGKTTVLVAYFERLVESGVDPLRILAITFTDKAANNMRDRLAQTFQDRPEIRGKLERAYVSTVHGFCARLLKENAVFAGLDPEFYVMDERESLREQRRAVDDALDDMFAEQPDRMRALMRGLAPSTRAGKCWTLMTRSARPAWRSAIWPASPLHPAAGYRTGAIAGTAPPAPVGWKLDQLAHLHEAQDWAGAHRGSFAGRRRSTTLRAMQSFTCKLTQAEAQQPHLRIAEVDQGLTCCPNSNTRWSPRIMRTCAPRLSNCSRASTTCTASASGNLGELDLRRSGRIRRAPAGGASGCAAAACRTNSIGC